MSETQIIVVGSQQHEIEVRPITVVIASPNLTAGPDIEYPGCLVIDPQATLYHAERVQRLHAEFEHCWRLFMQATSDCHPKPVVDYPVTPDHIRTMGTGAKHLMGLIDMSLKFQDQKVRTVMRHPESFLHPGWQVALGDLCMYLSGRHGPA